jgi:hypothetical protein
MARVAQVSTVAWVNRDTPLIVAERQLAAANGQIGVAVSD